MAIDDNTSYELTGYQVKDIAQKIRAKADSASLASVATSGLYSDLTGAPTIPTVYNGTLTIQHNGSTKGTFTANQSSASTVNIETIYADDYISTSPIPTTVTTAMIEDEAVTTAKIDDEAVTAAKIDWSTFGDQSSYFDIGNIRVAFGSAMLTGIASGAETPKSVSFGVSFSSKPIVTFTVANWVPVAFQVVSSASTSSFNALVKHNFGSTLDIPINWIAIGAKA